MKTRKLSVQHYRRHDTHNEHKRRLKSFIFSRLKRNSLKIFIHNFLSRIFIASSRHFPSGIALLLWLEENWISSACVDMRELKPRVCVLWDENGKKRKMNENKFLYNQKDSIVPCLRTSVVYVGWKTEISELYVERTKKMRKNWIKEKFISC